MPAPPALDWDAKTGKPLESTLQKLGLKELVRVVGGYQE